MVNEMNKNVTYEFIGEEEYRKKLGTLILEAREDKGITQRELANLIGVTNKSISKYENGLATPSSYVLNQICLNLDISYDSIISLQNENVRKLHNYEEKLIQKIIRKNFSKKTCEFISNMIDLLDNLRK